MTGDEKWRGDQEGFSTVAGAAVIAALATVLIGVIYLGAAVVARHRAQSAADLGALAGAIALAQGADGCAVAADLVAEAEGKPTVASCHTDAQDLVLRVRVAVSLGGMGVRNAFATARAGPVDGE